MNIYVGNLSYETAEEDLEKAFEIYGAVDTVKVIKDNYSGRSKGFGFVEMPNKSEAQSAIEGLNGKELKGRSLFFVISFFKKGKSVERRRRKTTGLKLKSYDSRVAEVTYSSHSFNYLF